MTTTSKPLSVTISARDLRDLLTPVLPLAGKDDMLPVLRAVNLRTAGAMLTAITTDRYRAGVCKFKPEAQPPKGFQALVRTRDLRHIMAVFKPSKFANPDLTLTIDSGRLTVTCGGGLDGMVDASLTFVLEDGEFPKLDKLIGDALADTPVTSTLGFDAGFLADFRLAVRSGEQLNLRMGSAENKPALVTVGDYFVGIIMPRTVAGGEATHNQTLSEWAALLAPGTKKAAA